MPRKNRWFDVRDLDTKVRPQDDFFLHASGSWMKKNPIPKSEARWGSFTMLRHATDCQLQALLQNVRAMRNVPTGSPEQMIRDFYRSGVDMKARQTRGLSPLVPFLARIEAIRTPRDIARVIGFMERHGSGGMWGAGVDQDMKNSRRYVVYLSQGGLGMPDRDYYLKNDAESRRVRSAYEKHLVRLFTLSGRGVSALQDMEVVMELETALAKASMKKEDVRDVDKTYHKKSLPELQRLAPHVHWREYMRALGAASARELIIMQPKFIIAVNHMLKTYPMSAWKTYLVAHVISDFSPFLTPAFEREHFAFYTTVLSGTRQMKPLWRRILRVANAGLGEVFGELYVRNYFPREAKDKVLAIVEDLFRAYEARIQTLDWMSAATKKRAILKLRRMTRKLGYPDKWKKYRGLVIRPTEYAENVMRVSAYEHRRQLRKLGKPVDRTEWFMSPQTVNAYCSFGLNDIVFPAAILQPPFFSPTEDDAFNYGAIGSVIGHEITHGFDDQGSKFDGYGNRKTWWTAKDRAQFTAKAKRLITQFDRYEVAPGLHLNGKLTLGENIADLGGISIAYDAYRLRLKNTAPKIIDGFTPEQRFFLGYAATEREQERPEFRKTQVMTDPHAPSRFRVNGPLSNLPEFYEAFGVQKGDKLYRAPGERAKIW